MFWAVWAAVTYTNDCVMRNSLHIETDVDIPFNLHCIDPDKFSHRKLNVFPRSELAKQLPSYRWNTYGQLIRHFCHTQNLSKRISHISVWGSCFLVATRASSASSVSSSSSSSSSSSRAVFLLPRRLLSFITSSLHDHLSVSHHHVSSLHISVLMII